MELGSKVKMLRERKGLTQEELAKRLGYSSKVSISKIENGRPISQKIIFNLSKVLDVSPAYLLGLEDDPQELSDRQVLKNLVDNLTDDEVHLLLSMLKNRQGK